MVSSGVLRTRVSGQLNYQSAQRKSEKQRVSYYIISFDDIYRSLLNE